MQLTPTLPPLKRNDRPAFPEIHAFFVRTRWPEDARAEILPPLLSSLSFFFPLQVYIVRVLCSLEAFVKISFNYFTTESKEKTKIHQILSFFPPLLPPPLGLTVVYVRSFS